MFLNYIYDMDGTLIDSKQEIKNGVIEMFDCIIENTPNAKFTIASGSRLNQIQATVNKIKSSTKNQIEFNIIAHAGSLILYNNKIIKSALSEEENNIVLEIIKKYDKEAMVVYRGLNEDYHIQPKTKKEADFYDAVLEIGNRYGIYSNPLSANEIEKNIKNQDVLSVEIVSVNFQNEIYEELKKLEEKFDWSVSNGYAIEISYLGKSKSIQKLFDKMNENEEKEIYSFENLVYMGDGVNDIPPFEKAKLSFGVGENLKILDKATFAIADFSEATNYIFVEKNTLPVKSKERIEFLKSLKK